jgi:hypothetical protein
MSASSTCTSCVAGQYQDVRGSAACKVCTAGSYSRVQTAYRCYNCPSGKFAALGTAAAYATACTACPGGQFQFVSGGASCAAAGQVACPSGQAFSSGTGRCERCPRGKHSDVTACVDCEANKYQTRSGRSECWNCPTGRFSTSTGASSSSGCSTCPAGQSAAAGRVCEQCAAGQVSGASGRYGAPACTACPYGKFVGTEGQTACNSCAAGFTTARTGCTASADCVAEGANTCRAGRYKRSSRSFCSSCPKGKYQDVSFATDCKECAAGLYQTQSGRTTCETCPSGRFSLSGSSSYYSCKTCSAGTFIASGSAGGSCAVCPSGKYSTQSGGDTCRECDAGKYGPFSGRDHWRFCYDCPKGKYAAAGGTTSCTPCAAGFTTPSPATASTSQCTVAASATDAAATSEGLCTTDVDLGFVMDASGSVGRWNFESMKTFVADVVRHFEIGANRTRVGVVTYSSRQALSFDMTKHMTNPAAIASSIDAIRYTGGGTRTGAAIAYAQSALFGAASGARPANAGVPKVLVVITDGKSQDRVSAAALQMKAAGTSVFAIGVGRGYDRDELDQLASEPTSEHVVGLTDFDLGSVLDKMRTKVCAEPAKAVITAPVVTVCEPMRPKYFKFTLEPEDKIQLNLTRTDGGTGAVTLYTSFDNRQPSAVNHRSGEEFADVTKAMAAGQRTVLQMLTVRSPSRCDGSKVDVYVGVVAQAGSAGQVAFALSGSVVVKKFHGCDFDAAAGTDQFCGWTRSDAGEQQGAYGAADRTRWQLKQGATPSAGTGPSGDHSTGTGSYIFVEASPACEQCAARTNETATITSPYMLAGSAAARASFGFAYHMRGAGMGGLQLLYRVTDDEDGAEADWSPLWSAAGPQADGWLSHTLNLPAATMLGVTKLQLRFVATVGPSFLSDFALDDFAFSDAGTAAAVSTMTAAAEPLAVSSQGATACYNAAAASAFYPGSAVRVAWTSSKPRCFVGITLEEVTAAAAAGAYATQPRTFVLQNFATDRSAGAVNVTLPAGMVPGLQYKIVVSSGASSASASTTTFTAAAQTITVAAVANFVAGEPAALCWAKHGGAAISGAAVSLSLHTCAGTLAGPLAAEQPSSGSWAWYSPAALAAGSYFVRAAQTSYNSATRQYAVRRGDSSCFVVTTPAADTAISMQLPPPATPSCMFSGADADEDRGYFFTAPTAFSITGLRVSPLAGASAAQRVQVVTFTPAAPVPGSEALALASGAWVSVFSRTNQPAAGKVSCSVAIPAGTVVGILGSRAGPNGGAVSAYGVAPAASSLSGLPVSLQRLHRETGGALGTDSEHGLGLVDMFYTASAAATSTIEFGLFDAGAPHALSGGWRQLDLATLQSVQQQFAAQYNDQASGGLTVLSGFTSGSCCFKLKGGKSLTIDGELPFPLEASATAAPSVYDACRNFDFVAGARYRFHNLPAVGGRMPLSWAAQLGETAVCRSDHNPSLFFRYLGAADGEIAPDAEARVVTVAPAADVTLDSLVNITWTDARSGSSVSVHLFRCADAELSSCVRVDARTGVAQAADAYGATAGAIEATAVDDGATTWRVPSALPLDAGTCSLGSVGMV